MDAQVNDVGATLREVLPPRPGPSQRVRPVTQAKPEGPRIHGCALSNRVPPTARTPGLAGAVRIGSDTLLPPPDARVPPLPIAHQVAPHGTGHRTGEPNATGDPHLHRIWTMCRRGGRTCGRTCRRAAEGEADDGDGESFEVGHVRFLSSEASFPCPNTWLFSERIIAVVPPGTGWRRSPARGRARTRPAPTRAGCAAPTRPWTR